MRHLTQRLALLLASFQGASRVAKRKDRQHIEAGRDVEQRLDFLESTEAYPVRAHAIGRRRPSAPGFHLRGSSCVVSRTDFVTRSGVAILWGAAGVIAAAPPATRSGRARAA